MVLSYFLLASLLGQKYVEPQTAVDPPVHVAEYVQKLGKKGHAIFAEKDLITIVARGKVNPVTIPDWFKVTAKESNGVWIAQVRYDKAEQTFFTYRTIEADTQTAHVFQGRKAIPLDPEAKALKGQLMSRTLKSESLGEDRKYRVYLPPGKSEGLPAVYLGDGECEYFAKSLEPLISSGRIAPVALVGISAGAYKGPKDKFDFMQDFRAREYLKVMDPEQFDKHLKFFCDEVVEACEKEFRFKSDRSARAVCGYSNGAAFALSAVNLRPDRFQNAFVLSLAATDFEDLKEIAKRKDIAVWLAAGKLEIFMGNTRKALEVLKANQIPVQLDEYESGHDLAMWRQAFLRRLEQAFPGPKSKVGR